jgi:hypothetical protein
MRRDREAKEGQDEQDLHQVPFERDRAGKFARDRRLSRKHALLLQTGMRCAAMLRVRARQEVRMATVPNPQDDAPRGEDQVPPTPDEAGPHDVPDDEVIEHTLPKRGDDTGRPR